MTMKYGSVQVALRRLSTPSYIQEPGKALATKWIWYWKDNDGWKKYAEQQVRFQFPSWHENKVKSRTLVRKNTESLRTTQHSFMGSLALFFFKRICYCGFRKL